MPDSFGGPLDEQCDPQFFSPNSRGTQIRVGDSIISFSCYLNPVEFSTFPTDMGWKLRSGVGRIAFRCTKFGKFWTFFLTNHANSTAFWKLPRSSDEVRELVNLPQLCTVVKKRSDFELIA